MRTYVLSQLVGIQDFPYFMERMERGFRHYSEGRVQLPPVGHLHFAQPPGDVHIKCASTAEAGYYVVKVASCFPQNRQVGLTSIQGMMLLFCQRTGQPAALFLDEGYLTHLRTGLAGAICARYLAPKNPLAIGMVGAGQQARFQLRCLAQVTSCREVFVWAPNRASCENLQRDESLQNFRIQIASSPQEVAQQCRLIVTTTPSLKPLLWAEDLVAGTHITAVGSDRPGKQELDPAILQRADRLIVDSRAQCFQYGETFGALSAGLMTKERIAELGEVIAGTQPGRQHEDEITVADLTGLGIQDLEIALAFKEVLDQSS